MVSKKILKPVKPLKLKTAPGGILKKLPKPKVVMKGPLKRGPAPKIKKPAPVNDTQPLYGGFGQSEGGYTTGTG